MQPALSSAPIVPAPALAVLDTNVWLDWLVFDDAGLAPLRAAHARGALVLVAAPATRAELCHVLPRPAFGLDARTAAARLAEHDRLVRLHDAPLARCALHCTDPDDQVFLDLAPPPPPALLVTKDRALLRLGPRARRDAGLRIVRPGDL